MSKASNTWNLGPLSVVIPFTRIAPENWYRVFAGRPRTGIHGHSRGCPSPLNSMRSVRDPSKATLEIYPNHGSIDGDNAPIQSPV